MARKRTKSKLPADPSDPALPIGLQPPGSDTVDLQTNPHIVLDERAAAAPSLSDLQIPDPRTADSAEERIPDPIPVPRHPQGEPISVDELFDYPEDPEPTSEEDRRKLAKRLAQEAMERIAVGKSADDDDTTVAVQQPDPPPPVDPPKATSRPRKKKRSLSDRARRPKSAKEALVASTTEEAPLPALAAKAKAKAKPKKAKAKAKAKAKDKAAPVPALDLETKPIAIPKKNAPKPPTQKPKAPPVEFEATNEMTAVGATIVPDTTSELAALEETAEIRPPLPVVISPEADPLAALQALGDTKVRRSVTVEERAIFAALWTAHGAHAKNDGNLAIAAMASVLIDAADRVPPGHLVAMEIEVDGVAHAVWVDAGRRCVLGVATPPAVWLVGL